MPVCGFKISLFAFTLEEGGRGHRTRERGTNCDCLPDPILRAYEEPISSSKGPSLSTARTNLHMKEE